MPVAISISRNLMRVFPIDYRPNLRGSCGVEEEQGPRYAASTLCARQECDTTESTPIGRAFVS
jgi:hypothetical protein